MVKSIRKTDWSVDIMWYQLTNQLSALTHKQLEMHRCALSTVATDALVLKHQAISSHSAD